MPWVTLADGDLHYIEAGARDKPPVVFLHGFGSCAQAWGHQLEALSDRYRVLAYDSVNHGHSSNSPRGEPEPDRADELTGFLAALAIERPILVGNSMGALTLLRWAVRHPAAARALVPLGMGVSAGAEDPAAQQRLRAMLTPIGSDVLFLEGSEGAFTAGFLSTPECARYVRLRSTATRLEAARHPRAATMADPSRAELADAVAGIRSPMQIIVGELDWLADDARRLHALVPHSRLAVVAGAPHNVYYETREGYQQVLEAFLADLPA